jgi:hypothetical protein
LRDRGRCKGGYCGRGGDAGARNELAAIHVSLPVSCQACPVCLEQAFVAAALHARRRLRGAVDCAPAAARASEAAKQLLHEIPTRCGPIQGVTLFLT